jgi:ubiquinone/menaquinone biosynthesis C-methylase UbiE
LDISETFVEIANRNAAQAQVQVDFQRGNASGMPFKSDSFDFLLCRAAFKNFGAPLGALREMHRVLKPGGRALIIDLRKDTSNESVAKAGSRQRELRQADVSAYAAQARLHQARFRADAL